MSNLTERFRNLDQRDQQYIEQCVTLMTNDGVDDDTQERWIAGAVAELEQINGTTRGLYVI